MRQHLRPEIERISPAKLPSNPFTNGLTKRYQMHVERSWAEPTYRFPPFGRIEAP